MAAMTLLGAPMPSPAAVHRNKAVPLRQPPPPPFPFMTGVAEAQQHHLPDVWHPNSIGWGP